MYPLSNHYKNTIMPGPGVGNKYRKYMTSLYRCDMEELFSSEFFKIKVDDELCRQDKIKYIYDNVPCALKNLRICTKWNGFDKSLNCHKCQKCIQTTLICNLLGIAKETSLKELSESEIEDYYNLYKNKINKSGDKYTYLRQINDLYFNYKNKNNIMF